MIRPKFLIEIVILCLVAVIAGACTGQEKPEGTLTVAELLDDPVYDVEVRIYGEVSGIGELACTCFPLLPIAFEEVEEFRDISVDVSRDITRSEVQDLKTHFNFISSSESSEGASEQFFKSALDRFSASFRFRDIQQSIVDLIVALEALFPVGEELRYRSAVSVASLLGTNDRERQRFFRSTYAGYKLRNTIVHGRGNQVKTRANALKELFPELEGKTNAEANKYIGRALSELQFIVRKTLRAYINLKVHDSQASWPAADDYDYLLFDLERCHQIQKQLGIKPITGEVPDFSYWQAIR